MFFLWQQLNISWGLDKFRGNVGNWREHIQRLEEDIRKVAVRYTLREDETLKSKLRLEMEQDCVEVLWRKT